ncbi:hypothetical protein MAPG_02050 [Magnaporthiopsis poae ATCC 64411]|uniref:Zn(2)-C6 fungal-type domain-containing protein n=1 Tax=Magnaporthiopsis poae (strain ATCC 64411 / 73-15) TaxID=644358 RepID=A0A0C4DQB2_MAGP6|nr:hypothetical protein MAPG_02050 [Magnaporthiopsis poae ATCC 64411]
MSPSASEALYEPMLTPPEEPPRKRHKTLACLRCRRRKQKCDEQRPCTNCARSRETCHEVVPRLAVVNSFLPALQMQQLASTADLCALEERVARLEKAQVHSRRQWHRRSDSSSTSSAASITGNDSIPGLSHQQVFSQDAVIPVHGDPAATAAGLSFNHWSESPETNGRIWQQQQMGQYCSPPPTGGSGMATNSAPAIGLLATFARSDSSIQQPVAGGGSIPPTPIDRATGLVLFDTYRARVHSRFAFLRLDKLQNLALSSSQQHPWTGFFTHMIYSISLLLLGNQQHQHHYRLAPGDDADEEEDAVRTQLRRRVFWSAYALDRSVCAALDLPPAVADAHVTAELYDAVEDAELEGSGSGSGNVNGPVSTALRLVQCLRIASEVLDIRLRRRRDGKEPWEMQGVVDRLEAWVRSCGGAEDMPPWLLSARDAGLAMLLGLGPASTSNGNSGHYGARAEEGPDGAETGVTATSLDHRALEACARLCTNRTPDSNGSDDDWLSLITQFKCGVALLHATAFSSSSSPSSTSNPAAIRACNATLSSLAERWPQAQCMRDVFATLAAEVGISLDGSGEPTCKRKRERERKRVKLESPLVAGKEGPDTRKAVVSQLPAVAAIVAHRPALRMLRELTTTRKMRLVGEAEGSDLVAGAEDVEGEDEKEEKDGIEIYDALTPAFFLPEPAPVKRDSRYDYLDFGETDDTRPWLDDGVGFRASA